jgi:aspartyl-tRNA(Asn)/glutamyl-tRNA(Gln) amidotransferase subunit A
MREGELETAASMAAALRAGAVTSSELVERALRRAEEWQPSINAFSQLWAEEAMREARRIDGLPPAERGPWTGVPVAVKDLFDVAGHETTGCCLAYRGTVPTVDAPIVERLREAGLVMIGKTNQHELAAGGTNLVSACGRTGNPWDPARMTGGSSGGSAAAVAAGVVPWALGSDTGGSIRIPASMCGTFGLKPTYGALPLAGVMPLAPSMDCPGPLAGSIGDLLALHELIGGVPTQDSPRRAFRIGVPNGFFTENVHEEVLAAVSEVGQTLEGAGSTVTAVDGRGIENVRRLWMKVCSFEFAAAHPALKDPARRALVAAPVVEWLEMGERQTDQVKAEGERAKVRRWFGERLEGLDALLIPTTPYPAPRADQTTVDLGPAGTVQVARVGPGWLTCSVNLAGLPAISIPAARSSEGMPIGVSLVAAEHGEGTLFALARLWSEASDYRPRLPG